MNMVLFIGMGLAIVKSIMVQLRDDVYCDKSALGGGENYAWLVASKVCNNPTFPNFKSINPCLININASLVLQN
jgi:hypothetical protein